MAASAMKRQETIRRHIENMTRPFASSISNGNDGCEEKVERSDTTEDVKREKYRDFLTQANAGSLSVFDDKRLSSLASLISSDSSFFAQKITFGHKHYTFGVKGLKQLVKVLPTSRIAYLDLSNSFLGKEGAFALAKHLPKTKIVTLKLFNTALDNESIETLARILPRTSVSVLDLGWNRIGDSGVAFLAAALPSCPVQDLNLGWNMIKNGGARELSRAFGSFRIRHLILSYNHIGAYGLRDLAEALPSSTVTTLWIGGNRHVKTATRKKYESVSRLCFECP